MKVIVKLILLICCLMMVGTIFSERVDKKIIHVGTTLDKERDVKDLGIRIENALRFVFDRVNKEGGVNGYEILFEPLSDSYDPVKARANIELFVNKLNTDIILLPVGTPTLEGYLDFVKEKKIIVLFPDTGSLLFRKHDLTNLINLRPSLYDEAYALTSFIIDKYSAKKFAFFCLENQYGKDLLKGAQDALKDNNITDEYFFFYDPKDLNFKEQIKDIRDKGVDSVGLFSASYAAKEFLRQLGFKLGFDWLWLKKIYGPSELDTTDFKEFLKNDSIPFVHAQVFPGPNEKIKVNEKEKEIPLITKFKQDVPKSNKMLLMDTYSLTGYIGALLFIDTLKQIEEPITKEKIIKKYEAMNNYDFEGLALTFNPKNRQLLQTVWINNGSEYLIPGKLKKEPEAQIAKEPSEEIPVLPDKTVELEFEEDEISGFY